ncbi:MAG: hypothetical protein GY870_22400 [archaeon]|nr:hypothetical protein [archaeon]
MICGIAILYSSMTYAYGDACTYLDRAGSMKRNLIFERYTAAVGLDETYMGEMYSEIIGMSNNLFLNVLKFIPNNNRFRIAQRFNIVCFLIFILWFFILHLKILLFFNIPLQMAILVSIFFALLLGIRTKLMFVVVILQSEIINYSLFILSVLLAFQISIYPSTLLMFLMGLGVGLAFRNRPTDIILYFSSIVYFSFLNIDIFYYLVFNIAFALCIIDFIYLKFRYPEMKTEGYLTGIFKFHTSKRNNPKFNFTYFKTDILSSLKKICNFYSFESLWPSIGSSIVILPISIIYLVKYQYLTKVFIFLLIYCLIYLFATLFIRKNQIGKKNNSVCFGVRQVYVLFPVFLIINGIAFSIAYFKREYLYCFVYVIWITFYIMHQVHKILDYYFSDSLRETGLNIYKKEPDSFRVDLANFIQTSVKPMVLMGYYLNWGEVFDNFQCTRDLQCVSILKKVDDSDILKIIKKYHITHIAVTPMSNFIGKGCSLRDNSLSNVLKNVLKRIDISPQIVIYEVRY